MEEKKEVTHSLHLEQRGHGLITGVTEMKSFDEENIFMETSQGTLAIRGNSLHVCRLELEKGEAEIEGKVDSLIYTQGRKEKKKGSLLKKAVSVDEHLYGERTGTAGTKYDLRCSSCSGL